MSTLSRHLLRQNLAFVAVSLLACVGIYLLVDVFDRLDRLLDRGAAIETILVYFLAKIPLIISQVLPAVFLITVILQITMMHRNRELVALEAGGVSYGRIVVFFLGYALIWCGLQLVFSQQLGIAGEVKSERIWETVGKEDVQSRQVLRDIWFKDGGYIVHIHSFHPETRQGSSCRIVSVSEGFTKAEEFITADRFQVEENSWVLEGVTVFHPDRFTMRRLQTKRLPLEQDPSALATTKDEDSPERLPLWRLGEIIDRLQAAGVNTSALKTAWHMKLSYAGSMLIMAMVGLVLSKKRENLFLNLVLGIVITFAFYFLYVFGGTLGEKGLLVPWVAGWFGSLLVGLPAAAMTAWRARQ